MWVVEHKPTLHGAEDGRQRSEQRDALTADEECVDSDYTAEVALVGPLETGPDLESVAHWTGRKDMQQGEPTLVDRPIERPAGVRVDVGHGDLLGVHPVGHHAMVPRLIGANVQNVDRDERRAGAGGAESVSVRGGGSEQLLEEVGNPLSPDLGRGVGGYVDAHDDRRPERPLLTVTSPNDSWSSNGWLPWEAGCCGCLGVGGDLRGPTAVQALHGCQNSVQAERAPRLRAPLLRVLGLRYARAQRLRPPLVAGG
jgi:hypothetical protein